VLSTRFVPRSADTEFIRTPPDRDEDRTRPAGEG
jgi:hypothetical protein